MNCFDFLIYNELDFEIKTFKGIRLRIETFTKCQTWIKKFAAEQILNEKFYNVSGFEINYIQRVSFWIEDLKTCHILKEFAYKKITCWIMLLRENGMFCIFSAISKSMILKQKMQNCVVYWNKKITNGTFWR